MPEDATRELLSRIRGGDREALDALCGRYLPRLRRWAHGRLPPWARGRLDTDDLVQETVVRSLEQMGAFEPRWDGALQAYFRHALVNRIRDEIRWTARRPSAAELPVDPPARSPARSCVWARSADGSDAPPSRPRRAAASCWSRSISTRLPHRPFP